MRCAAPICVYCNERVLLKIRLFLSIQLIIPIKDFLWSGNKSYNHNGLSLRECVQRGVLFIEHPQYSVDKEKAAYFSQPHHNETMKVLPLPSADLTSSVPSKFSTIASANDKPRPYPSILLRLLSTRYKRSKIRS